YNNGGMYKIYNSNLLFHGCMILDNDGDFKDVPLGNKHFKGKELFDILDKYVRDAYFCKENQYKDFCLDIMWFLWCGKNSPQFGKLKMSTFERYFIEDESSYLEGKIPYYKYRNEESTADKILNEFGLIPNSSHIINGHIPVKTKNGENPVKAGGKIIVIDGGFCKAYQPKTGIAGYTLIYNSYGILLTSQQPFVSTEIAITEDKDMIFSSKIIKKSSKRITVADTDIGKELQEQINNLFKLVNLYYNNTINEKF
ncbi:MAG: fructose-bisphosphatase class III, partial [Clostridiaceae bacterium]